MVNIFKIHPIKFKGITLIITLLSLPILYYTTKERVETSTKTTLVSAGCWSGGKHLYRSQKEVDALQIEAAKNAIVTRDFVSYL
ncbi:MAG: hypothetical protein ACI9YH_000113 [Colwellia sp.]